VGLHVGDHDPDGTDLFKALSDDVTAFLAEDAPEARVVFERIAVTPEQIVEHRRPTAPPKSDSGNPSRNARVARWIAEGNVATCQRRR
jgi:hypothetical protein